MMKDWNIIHEIDNGDGRSTCYTRKLGDQQWWLALLTAKAWGFTAHLVKVKDLKTAAADIRWVENHYQTSYTKRKRAAYPAAPAVTIIPPKTVRLPF